MVGAKQTHQLNVGYQHSCTVSFFIRKCTSNCKTFAKWRTYNHVEQHLHNATKNQTKKVRDSRGKVILQITLECFTITLLSKMHSKNYTKSFDQIGCLSICMYLYIFGNWHYIVTSWRIKRRRYFEQIILFSFM